VLAAFAILVLVAAVFIVAREADAPLERLESPFMEWLAELRTPWLTSVMEAVDRLGQAEVVWFLRVAILVGLLVFKRWRHLFTFVGLLIVVDGISAALIGTIGRPRPMGVEILGDWRSYSLPSIAVVTFSITVISGVYCFAPAGAVRRRAALAAGIAIAALCLSRLYLGASHPLDVAMGVLIAVSFGVPAFRYFAPDEVEPVTYGGGKAAHVDLGGARGEAIVRAIRDQLGYTAEEVKPFGEAGSGASTPMRIEVAELDEHLFAKLYTMRHVRSDRWYKVIRTIMYGRLEDEVPFKSVRRLVQYEDYALRLLEDVGFPVAKDHGVVELTPDREYMLVTGFFEDAKELGEAEVSPQVIDEGLAMVRKLWDEGLAARDIKPSNLLVQDGHLKYIDVFFLEVRPTPWRQAVDLANMMLTLALRTDAETVYERALASFTPEEIAEAFAAIQGLAVPTELQRAVKEDGRGLIERFRELTPSRPTIPIQRWSLRRVTYTVGVGLGVLVGAMFIWSSLGRGL
jgi:membrane-associated phospholipid phosphatase/tRNA A-37 threonylcarbamoyl transferase component Bud32